MIDILIWAETATEGKYLAYYDDMVVLEAQPGYYVVRHDANGRVVWEGQIAEEEDVEQGEGGRYDAYERAELSDVGSRCGWDDDELAEANRILSRSGLVLQADDIGLCAVLAEGASSKDDHP